jgi:hypothetical protein
MRIRPIETTAAQAINSVHLANDTGAPSLSKHADSVRAALPASSPSRFPRYLLLPTPNQEPSDRCPALPPCSRRPDRHQLASSVDPEIIRACPNDNPPCHRGHVVGIDMTRRSGSRPPAAMTWPCSQSCLPAAEAGVVEAVRSRRIGDDGRDHA